MSHGVMETAGALLVVLTPLFAVPLTVIIFYLRSLREQQSNWQTEMGRRMESVEATVRDTRGTVAGFERDYTTKEEWLRECMQVRRVVEQLRETGVRIETLLDGMPPASVFAPRTPGAGRSERGGRGERKVAPDGTEGRD